VDVRIGFKDIVKDGEGCIEKRRFFVSVGK